MKDFLWCEKYRPRRVADTILPDSMKALFQQSVDTGEVQNMLLVGSPGTGKTTVAKALCDELGIDFLLVNASEDGQIGNLRTTIRSFASTLSMKSNIKVIILDECDGLSPASMAAFRGFIDEFSASCRFIFTANFRNKIIEPLQSRLVVVEFAFSRDEKLSLIKQADSRIRHILDSEGVEYDRKMLAQLIVKHFPDFRKTINELQRYSREGVLSIEVLQALSSDTTNELVEALRDTNFTMVRKWVAENSNMEPSAIQLALYNKLKDVLEPQSIPQLVLILADYDYKSSFVVNKEIHNVAMCVEVMSKCRFK
jgi:replication factor C small subunit